MNVSLTPELEEFINARVESGLYNSASEVVRQALRLLVREEEEQQTKLEGLRRAIEDGFDSGEAAPYDRAATLKRLRES